MPQSKARSIQIAGVVITQDAHGRYSLNDLHRAAGGERRHLPAEFLRIGQTQELITELTRDDRYGKDHIGPVEAIRGGPNQGTYVCRQLVYAYAMWVAPKFHLKVIDVFDAATGGHPAIQALPGDYLEALEALVEAERAKVQLAEQAAAQQRQLAEQQPAVEFVERFVDAKSTKGIRQVAKVLGLKEKAFIAQLEADGVVFRQGGKLMPSAGYQHQGLFEVKTGEANGYAFVQLRFTPAGIAWAAQRYAMPRTRKLLDGAGGRSA